MCKNSVVVISSSKASKKDEQAYIQETRREILSSGKKIKDGELKVDINFIDHNGHIDYQSKKGSHIKKVVFDFSGHRDESKIIAHIKKGLSKVNKVPDPVYLRVANDGINHDGCVNILKIKHAVTHENNMILKEHIGC